jgi:hypothetical protein
MSEKGFTTFTSVGTKPLPNDNITTPASGDGAGKQPGMLELKEQDGTPWYLWVDSTGNLKIANAIPTDPDGTGTVVGTQT